MIKRIIICWAMLLVVEKVNAQGKQIQYLVQQIAELRIYLGYLRSGYNIVQTGLNTIRDIRDGEFRLHALYYNSLKQVNPKIRQSAQVAGIVLNQQYIIKSTTALKKAVRESDPLPDRHRQFVLQACEKLLQDVGKNAESLLDVISSGTFEMSDDGRMSRINALYKQSINQLVFIQQLSSETAALLHSSAQEQADEELLESFYNTK